MLADELSGQRARRQFLGAVHQERQRDEDRGHGDHDPDDIDIGQQPGLDLGHAVDLRAGVVDGVGQAEPRCIQAPARPARIWSKADFRLRPSARAWRDASG